MGLPDRSRFTELPAVDEKNTKTWHYAVQEHDAHRAGKHYDLRLGDPATRVAHSWAVPKAVLPAPGERVLAVRQPDHTIPYMDFSGVLPSGYGAGVVRKKERSPVEVVYSKPDKMKFVVHKGKESDEYVLLNTKDKSWLLMNTTPTKERVGLPSSKPAYKEMDPSKIDIENASQILQAKIDGAHVLVDINPHKQTRVYSYRPTERKTGIIEHTYRVPGVLGHRGDLGGRNAVRAEVYAKDKNTGRALTANEIGAMLNSSVPLSREKQRALGNLTMAAIDPVISRGRDVSGLPYERKRAILEELASKYPSILHLPASASTKEEKARLIEEIKSGRHPQTKEGLVVWDKNSPIPTKAKFRPDFDVVVRSIFPAFRAKDKSALDRAGGFRYSSTADGPVLGRVGTGFRHDVLKDMLANPSKYEGRVAKVRSLERLRSGALRAPSFSAWHLDKGKE